MKLLYIICAGIIFFSSCASGKENMKTTTPLYNTKWSLKKIHNDTGTEEVQTKAFIRFEKEKGSAGGNGSCNSFGSNFIIDNNKMSFKNIFSTKMYCDEVQKIETAFFGQLGKVTRFEIKDKTLLLFQDKELLLQFEAE